MSWSDYIVDLMAKDQEATEDAAIVCFTEGSESVWAAHDNFKKITGAEVKKLVSKDRSSLFTDGLMLGGQKCRVILDNLFKEERYMNLMTKEGNAITVSMANTVLVILKGCKSVHGRQLLPHTINLAEYLKKQNY